MKYREFGLGQKETILLLHGGGLSWWNYLEAAKLLQTDFHIILPILDGHAGSDRPFTTIEENASEIISFIDAQFGTSVLMIGGLSLGGQVLLEMLSQRRDLCSYALVESASVIPSKLTNKLIAPALGGSYRLIKNRGFAKMQFSALRIKPPLFEDYYRDTCQIRKEDMISFMKSNTSYSLKDSLCRISSEVHVYYGSRETGLIKRSAERIGSVLPNCRLHSLPGFYHGDFSLNHADAYADAVRKIVRRNQVPKDGQ